MTQKNRKIVRSPHILVQKKVKKFMYDRPTGSVSEIQYKSFTNVHTSHEIHTQSSSQFQSLHHDFKCHFQVQSLSVLLHNVFCQQTLELLVTERAWPIPSPMCTQHPAQILQSPDMPGPQVHHTIPQLRPPPPPSQPPQ